MATLAQFSTPTDAMPISVVFESLPDAVVELERIVPTAAGIFPYFWVRGDDPASIVETVEASDAFESVTLVDRAGDRCLFRAVWREFDDCIVTAIARSDVTLLRGIGDADGWQFQIRADDSGALSAFQAYCRDHGIGVDLVRLHALDETPAVSHFGLTDPQREAIVLAFDAGYYEVPHTVTLGDLAGDLGITRQSLAARLQRGHRNLIANTVCRR